MRIVVQQLNKQQTKNRAGGPMGIWGHLLSLQILAKLAEKSVASKDVVLTDRPPPPKPSAGSIVILIDRPDGPRHWI